MMYHMYGIRSTGFGLRVGKDGSILHRSDTPDSATVSSTTEPPIQNACNLLLIIDLKTITSVDAIEALRVSAPGTRSASITEPVQMQDFKL